MTSMERLLIAGTSFVWKKVRGVEVSYCLERLGDLKGGH